jgi:uncharacterized membrane protein YsdA (DUF1294 family)/cold shock CspA family protein
MAGKCQTPLATRLRQVISGSLIGCFTSVDNKLVCLKGKRCHRESFLPAPIPALVRIIIHQVCHGRLDMARFEGSLVSWNSERGFGFIKPKEGGRDIFVHVRDLQFKGRAPLIGNAIIYDITQRSDGKYRAVNAYIIGEKHNKSISNVIIIVITFILITIQFILSLYIINITYYPLVLYIIFSVLCFFVYVYDKQMAIHGGWRIQESSLHWLEFIGGWPGALIAQMIIGHKNSKGTFQFIFWAIVMLHFIAWAAYLLLY